MRIDDIEDIAIVSQLLRAHEYWRMKQLAVDLVILNERSSSYIQDLHIAIETMVRTSQSRPRVGADEARGAVFVLRADQMCIRDSAWRASSRSPRATFLPGTGSGSGGQSRRSSGVPR